MTADEFLMPIWGVIIGYILASFCIMFVEAIKAYRIKNLWYPNPGDIIIPKFEGKLVEIGREFNRNQMLMVISSEIEPCDGPFFFKRYSGQIHMRDNSNFDTITVKFYPDGQIANFGFDKHFKRLCNSEDVEGIKDNNEEKQNELGAA